MTKRNTKQKANQNNGSGKKSGKGVLLDLGGKLGTGLIAGLTPIIIGAIGKAVGGLGFHTSGRLAALEGGRGVATPVGSGYGSSLPVSIPASNGTIVRSGKPNMRTTSNGNCTVTHREYVADLIAQVEGFDLQFQFGMNPGNPGLFPWLSTIASRFELYKFRALRLIYEPQSATTTTGTVMIAADYDASDPPPSSKVQMMSYKRSVRSPPWFACTHESAGADLHRLKTNYVLGGVAPTGTDIKTYDIGNLYVALQSDVAQGTTCGELYVEYTVDLITPQINNEAISYSGFRSGGLVALNTPLGTAQEGFGSLPVDISTNGSTPQAVTIQVPGFYVINIVGTNVDSIVNVIFNASANNVKFFAAAAPGEDSNGNSVGVYFIQVVNGAETTFTMELSNVAPIITPTSNFSLFITPFSEVAMPTTDFTSNFEPVFSQRARLGRRHV